MKLIPVALVTRKSNYLKPWKTGMLVLDTFFGCNDGMYALKKLSEKSLLFENTTALDI